MELPDQSLIICFPLLIGKFPPSRAGGEDVVSIPSGAVVLSPPSRDIYLADRKKCDDYWNLCLVVVPHRVSYHPLISSPIEFLL